MFAFLFIVFLLNVWLKILGGQAERKFPKSFDCESMKTLFGTYNAQEHTTTYTKS